jgi:hypothetical protein
MFGLQIKELSNSSLSPVLVLLEALKMAEKRDAPATICIAAAPLLPRFGRLIAQETFYAFT